jgi:hypothetical protein
MSLVVWHTYAPSAPVPPPPERALEDILNVRTSASLYALATAAIANGNTEPALVRFVRSFDRNAVRALNAVHYEPWDTVGAIRAEYARLGILPRAAPTDAIRLLMARMMSYDELWQVVRDDPNAFFNAGRTTSTQQQLLQDCAGNTISGDGSNVARPWGLDPEHHWGVIRETQRMACCDTPVGSIAGCWIALAKDQMYGVPRPYVLMSRTQQTMWDYERGGITGAELSADYVVGTGFRDYDRCSALSNRIIRAWADASNVLANAFERFKAIFGDAVVGGTQRQMLDPYTTMLTESERATIVAPFALMFEFNRIFCARVPADWRVFVNIDVFRVQVALNTIMPHMLRITLLSGAKLAPLPVNRVMTAAELLVMNPALKNENNVVYVPVTTLLDAIYACLLVRNIYNNELAPITNDRNQRVNATKTDALIMQFLTDGALLVLNDHSERLAEELAYLQLVDAQFMNAQQSINLRLRNSQLNLDDRIVGECTILRNRIDALQRWGEDTEDILDASQIFRDGYNREVAIPMDATALANAVDPVTVVFPPLPACAGLANEWAQAYARYEQDLTEFKALVTRQDLLARVDQSVFAFPPHAGTLGEIEARLTAVLRETEAAVASTNARLLAHIDILTDLQVEGQQLAVERKRDLLGNARDALEANDIERAYSTLADYDACGDTDALLLRCIEVSKPYVNFHRASVIAFMKRVVRSVGDNDALRTLIDEWAVTIAALDAETRRLDQRRAAFAEVYAWLDGNAFAAGSAKAMAVLNKWLDTNGPLVDNVAKILTDNKLLTKAKFPVHLYDTYDAYSKKAFFFQDEQNAKRVWRATVEYLVMPSAVTEAALTDAMRLVNAQPVRREIRRRVERFNPRVDMPLIAPNPPGALFESATSLLWANNSCPMDAILMSLFAIPETPWAQRMFTQDYLIGPAKGLVLSDGTLVEFEDQCDERDVRKLGGLLLEDISTVQTPGSKKSVCTAYGKWTKCVAFPLAFIKDTLDADEVLMSIMQLFDLDEFIQNEMLPVNSRMDQLPERTKPIFICNVRDYTAIMPPEDEVPVRDDDADYVLSAVIYGDGDHFTTHVKDHYANVWRFFDIGSGGNVYAANPSRDFQNQRPPMYNLNKITGTQYSPHLYVYFRRTDVDRIVERKREVLRQQPSPQLDQGPYPYCPPHQYAEYRAMSKKDRLAKLAAETSLLFRWKETRPEFIKLARAMGMERDFSTAVELANSLPDAQLDGLLYAWNAYRDSFIKDANDAKQRILIGLMRAQRFAYSGKEGAKRVRDDFSNDAQEAAMWKLMRRQNVDRTTLEEISNSPFRRRMLLRGFAKRKDPAFEDSEDAFIAAFGAQLYPQRGVVVDDDDDDVVAPPPLPTDDAWADFKAQAKAAGPPFDGYDDTFLRDVYTNNRRKSAFLRAMELRNDPYDEDYLNQVWSFSRPDDPGLPQTADPQWMRFEAEITAAGGIFSSVSSATLRKIYQSKQRRRALLRAIQLRNDPNQQEEFLLSVFRAQLFAKQ